MPMSAQMTWPQWSGAEKWTGLQLSKVTVTSARTAPGAAAPVSALHPLGRSAAKTRAPSRRQRSSKAQAAAPCGRSVPWKPVPYSASTAAAKGCSGQRVQRAQLYPRHTRQQLPVGLRIRGTGFPFGQQDPYLPASLCCARAVTKPSPPLLPLPQTTSSRPGCGPAEGQLPPDSLAGILHHLLVAEPVCGSAGFDLLHLSGRYDPVFHLSAPSFLFLLYSRQSRYANIPRSVSGRGMWGLDYSVV